MQKPIVRRVVADNHAVFHSHPVLQKIYAARGVQSADELERDLKQLLPYQQLKNCTVAAEKLADAIITNLHFLVVGDFDADGATSTAVVVTALREMGAQQVSYLVPNRFEYGYGLTPEIVAVAANKKPDILITVDNGISSIAGVSAARAAGMQVIITDHHLPAAQLPDANAIVNPQQPGCEFKSKNLAGVGVIFYVMMALRAELRERNWFVQQKISEPNIAQLLDLVALGTVADVVPLDHNNRILVYQGLQRIRAGKVRPGILALLEAAGRNPQNLSAMDLGFSIAPRLNAAGRLADMSLGIECLLSNDVNHARELALQLNLLNDERRVIEKEMQAQAFTALQKIQLKREQLPFGICLFDENWHQGVIGLLASRVKEAYHRPTIVFAPGNTALEIKGSARSIPGLHIRDTLDAVASRYPHLITKFGGHAMAAGLSLDRTNYAEFTKAFAEEVERNLAPENLQGKIYSDGELQPADFCVELAELLRSAGPWGQMFPEPTFDGRFKIVQQRIVGTKHLKLTLIPENTTQQIDAIAFNVNMDVWPDHHATHLKAAYRLDINEYLGRRSVQLVLEQIEAVYVKVRDTETV